MAEKLNPNVAEFLNTALQHFIGGQWVPSTDGAVEDVINPSDGTVICQAAMAAAHEVDAAVNAAHKAFPAWAGKPPNERGVLLHRLADALEKHAADLAQLESLDVGKAIVNSETFDIPFGVEGIRYFADLALHITYDVPLAVKHIEARTHRVPYGVCGFIFPWNFPYDLLVWGIMPALAAGNTVVVKPSEVTPLSTLFVCKLAAEVGFPAGVINVVNGTGTKAGAILTAHPLVKRMSFTGSPPVGKLIGETCGRNLVPCKLELGGKGAAVIFDDVDVEATAQQLAAALTLNTGQVCCTATRWIIHEKIHDQLLAKAAEILKNTRIGPALDRNTQMGPLVSKAQQDRVNRYVETGKKQGAVAVLEPETLRIPGHEGGYYVSPSLLTGSSDNICCREEIFGPSAFALKFRHEDEALQLVNSLSYGLANSVWSRNLKRANRVAERMIAGSSWINAHNIFAYGLPYGGANLSGMGGGVNSPETLHDYLRSQTIARPL
ncbi:MAG: aldehyde dehydrogenase family protein [Phycisphaerae bacterium]